MQESLRRRVYVIVEVPPEAAGIARLTWFNVGIATLIVLNVLSSMLGTVPSIDARVGTPILVFEFASACVFLVEYVARVWACVENPRYAHPLWGRLRFMLSPLAVIDLLAFAPTLLTAAGVDLVALRVARLFRIGRVVALGRYNTGLTALLRVVRSRRSELAIMSATMLFVVIVSATIMYYFEHEAQPETFGSIPAAMWWAVITLTTIGYGDAVPTTVAGKIVGAIVALCGVGVVALPTAVIAQGFAEEVHNRRARQAKHEPPHVCPHCGKEIH